MGLDTSKFTILQTYDGTGGNVTLNNTLLEGDIILALVQTNDLTYTGEGRIFSGGVAKQVALGGFGLSLRYYHRFMYYIATTDDDGNTCIVGTATSQSFEKRIIHIRPNGGYKSAYTGSHYLNGDQSGGKTPPNQDTNTLAIGMVCTNATETIYGTYNPRTHISYGFYLETFTITISGSISSYGAVVFEIKPSMFPMAQII
jgi:hypothetical protein